MPGLPDDLATPAGTAYLLRRFGVRPRKRFGQHFLVSRRGLDQILAAADLTPDDTVLEVGGGLGTLTAALAQRAGRVIVVEVDRTLLPVLRATVSPFANVHVVPGDIRSLELADVFAGHTGPRKVVANLPYSLAATLVVSLLEQPLGLARLVVTVQREVAQRMGAPPGTRDYGVLSVAVQYRADVSLVARLPPSAFVPPPDVESAVVRLEVRAAPTPPVADEAMLFRVVRAAFGQRRKTVRNALAGGIPLTGAEADAACARAGIVARRRGETLDLREFAALAEAVAETLRRRNEAPVAEGP